MNRNTWPVAALALCAWLGVTLIASPAHATQPNIVLFVVDDMGWADWQQHSDYYETPNMTRLANAGVAFTRAYASASICSPTRASILTGLSPASHRITKWIPALADNKVTHVNEPESNWNLSLEYTTLAEALRQDGYATAHIGKWHLGEAGNPAADPRQHGFDLNIGGTHAGSPPSYVNRNAYLNLPNLDGDIHENYLTDHLAREAAQYIRDRAAANERFFLNFDLFAVHTPIQAHPDYIEYFTDKPAGEHHGNAAYATMIKAMDDALGRVLDTLQEQGIADQTLVIFTSDNGGLTTPAVTANTPLRDGKGTAFEGGHRVPLIIAGPGVTPGEQSDFLTISHDLYPTILQFAGVAGDARHNALVEGVSIADVARGAMAGDRDSALFWHFPHISNHGGGPYGAVVLDDWKFIENYETGEMFLFNLADDLGETTNLQATHPQQLHELRSLLHRYLRDTDAQLWNGYELTEIPEPATAALLSLGALFILRRQPR